MFQNNNNNMLEAGSHFHQHHNHQLQQNQLLEMNNQNTPESDIGRNIRDDELFDDKSGSDNIEGGSGEEQDPTQRPNKKKRYHRHTQHQIQEMEA